MFVEMIINRLIKKCENDDIKNKLLIKKYEYIIDDIYNIYTKEEGRICSYLKRYHGIQ